MANPSTDRALPTPTPCDFVTLEVRTPGERSRRVTMEHEELLLGRAEFCDVQLSGDDVPLVHAELHRQGGVLWIEAAVGAAPLEINGRPCNRLALRHGDTLRVGSTEIEVLLGAEHQRELTGSFDEDLSDLTADELCDRILAEEAEITAFEQRRFDGWKRLVTALEGTILEAHAQGGTIAADRIATALVQLRELSTRLAEQSARLADRETAVLDATADLRIAQDAMSRKLDQFLQRFDDGELRASA